MVIQTQTTTSIKQKGIRPIELKGFQHSMLARLRCVRWHIEKKIEDKNMSWPAYAWFFDGKYFDVVMWGYTYEKENNVTKNTGVYSFSIFRTVFERDAIFAVELFRKVFNSPSAARHNWNPKGDKKPYRHKHQVVMKPLRASQQVQSNFTAQSLITDERILESKPFNMSASEWAALLTCLGITRGWKPVLPIGSLAIYLKFDEWIEDIQTFNTGVNVAFEGLKEKMEAIAEFAMEDNIDETAIRCLKLMQEIRASLMVGYN